MSNTSYCYKLIKKTTFLIATLLFVVSCAKENKIKKEVEAVEVNLEIVRFDKIFYETPVE